MKKKAPISKEKRKRLIAKAVARLSTPEGQAELKKVFERGEKIADEFKRKCRVSREQLEERFGPNDPSGLWPHQK